MSKHQRSLWICALLIGVAAIAWALMNRGKDSERQNKDPKTTKSGAPDVVRSSGCAISDVSPPPLNVPVRRPSFGQEIWVSYQGKEVQHLPGRYPRTKERALELIKEHCEYVRGGGDLGELARRASNGRGGRAYGFTVAPIDPKSVTRRDLVLMGTPIGEITPVIEWNGGYWFARRVDERRGNALLQVLKNEAKRRARARVIVFPYKDTWPPLAEKRDVTREMAHAHALDAIAKLKSKDMSFEELASKYSFDTATRERGGVLVVKHPKTKKETEWIHWGTRDLGQDLLAHLLDSKTPIGRINEKPLDFHRGWMVVEVLARDGD